MSSTKASRLRPNVLLPHEDLAEYESLTQELTGTYKPATPAERLLLTRVVDSYWRVLRARRLEVKLLARMTGNAVDPEDGLLDFITGPQSPQYQKLLRHQAQVDLAWRRAVSDLEKALKQTKRPKPADSQWAAWTALSDRQGGLTLEQMEEVERQLFPEKVNSATQVPDH